MAPEAGSDSTGEQQKQQHLGIDWCDVQIEPNGVAQGFSSIREGDCVVAFSRKSIYEVKALIEKHTGLK